MSELRSALEIAAAKYAEKLRSESSLDEHLPPKEKAEGSTPSPSTTTKKTRK